MILYNLELRSGEKDITTCNRVDQNGINKEIACDGEQMQTKPVARQCKTLCVENVKYIKQT